MRPAAPRSRRALNQLMYSAGGLTDLAAGLCETGLISYAGAGRSTVP
jgi:hypothetical protein